MSETENTQSQKSKTTRVAFISMASALFGFDFCLLCFVLRRSWFWYPNNPLTVPVVILGPVLFFAPILVIITLIVLYNISPLRMGKSIICFLAILFLFSIFFLGFRQRREEVELLMCQANLHDLVRAIFSYAEDNDNHLPVANQWCTLISEHDKNLSKDVFRCPGGLCDYAFNKNLSGLRLTDVAGNIVLVYETGGGWNLAGGAEKLSIRHHNERCCNVLFTNGAIRAYRIEELVKQPLRWKP